MRLRRRFGLAAAWLAVAAALLLCSGCSGDSIVIVGGDGPIGFFVQQRDESPATSRAAGDTLAGRPPYDRQTSVVVSTAADIYEEADNTSKRLTQALFDQPVKILETSGQWALAEADGGARGWTRARNVDGDWACIDRRRFDARIVVTSKNKQIYSHPRNGIVVRDVGMGTELFVISKSESVYEVALPGNVTGWLSENGTFQLDAGEDIKRTTAAIFAQSCEKFRGTSYLQGGVSFQGIDGAGLLYAAMKVNGVALPRDLGGQMLAGAAVGFEEAEVGDVFFFGAGGAASGEPGGGEPGGAEPGGGAAGYAGAAGAAGASPDSGALNDAGVYMGDGKFLHASQHAGKVMYDDISDPYYQQRLLAVRRYF
ncbi:MAG: C40 family peptidase [Clostridiales bacterium]|nr:C40 family peptidase [Clostridiales bacterium]